MQSMSAKMKLAITVLGGAILMTLLYFFFLLPLATKLEDLHGQAQRAEIDLTKLKLEEQSYQRAQADYDRISARIADINRLFPVKEELVGIVKELEAAAIASDDTFTLSITDVSEVQADPRQKKEEKPYEIVPNLVNVEVIPYDFQMQGSFRSIVTFLQTLEHQSFFSEIEVISLSSDKTQLTSVDALAATRTGTVNATIRSAFYTERSKK